VLLNNQLDVSDISISRNTIKDHDDELEGYFFESWIGLQMEIKLENYDKWKEQGIMFSLDDDQAAVLEFGEWEDRGEQQFRTTRALKKVIKHAHKIINQGKLIQNLEDNLIMFEI